MKLYIKYMVSHRCKLVVMAALDGLGLHYSAVELGEVKIEEELTPEQHDQLAITLMKSGLELMDDKKAILIETIKNIIVEMVHYSDEVPRVNFSDYLSENLHFNYAILANLFSQTTGITIEHYFIIQKVERIKELLLYEELNITEISYKLNYSSVAHLSSQFKRITGLTPSYFKKIRQFRARIPLEDL
ncbi:MAG: helix-turn-helix transcriptional regulator [Haliscomenobacter sp.]|nr:helix-turn-helix transcriptional regulator [Haliscomenobacter sp.]